MGFHENIDELTAIVKKKHPALTKAPQTAEEPRLNAWDQSIVGKAIRIEIPFTDIYKMREIAEMLHGLAADLDFTSRRTDHPPLDSKDYAPWRRSMLRQLRETSLLINHRIRYLHGKHNKNGTTK